MVEMDEETVDSASREGFHLAGIQKRMVDVWKNEEEFEGARHLVVSTWSGKAWHNARCFLSVLRSILT